MYNAFFDLISSQLFSNASVLCEYAFTFGNSTITLDAYFTCLLATICTITVYVCVCLIVVKVIKLFGRLWSRF